MVSERVNPMQAFWMSPDGEHLAVPERHVREIIRDPERFGLDRTEPSRLYSAVGEPVGSEQYARELLIKRVVLEGWIRGRGSREGWSLTARHLDHRTVLRLQRLALDFVTGELVVPEPYRSSAVQLTLVADGLTVHTSFDDILCGALRSPGFGGTPETGEGRGAPPASALPRRTGRSRRRPPAERCCVCRRDIGSDEPGPRRSRRLIFWPGGALYLWPRRKPTAPHGARRNADRHRIASSMTGRYRHLALRISGLAADESTVTVARAQAMAGERPWVCQFCAGAGLCRACRQPLKWVASSDTLKEDGRVLHSPIIPGAASCTAADCPSHDTRG